MNHKSQSIDKISKMKGCMLSRAGLLLLGSLTIFNTNLLAAASPSPAALSIVCKQLSQEFMSLNRSGADISAFVTAPDHVADLQDCLSYNGCGDIENLQHQPELLAAKDQNNAVTQCSQQLHLMNFWTHYYQSMQSNGARTSLGTVGHPVPGQTSPITANAWTGAEKNLPTLPAAPARLMPQISNTGAQNSNATATNGSAQKSTTPNAATTTTNTQPTQHTINWF